MVSRPSSVHTPSVLLSLPPAVSRRTPVPSGATTWTWVLSPPPGATVYAIRSPLGDHASEPTASLPEVTCTGQPPSVGTTKICGTPVRLDRNASDAPSGENDGVAQNPTAAIRATWSA